MGKGNVQKAAQARAKNQAKAAGEGKGGGGAAGVAARTADAATLEAAKAKRVADKAAKEAKAKLAADKKAKEERDAAKKIAAIEATGGGKK